MLASGRNGVMFTRPVPDPENVTLNVRLYAKNSTMVGGLKNISFANISGAYVFVAITIPLNAHPVALQLMFGMIIGAGKE